MIAMKMTDVKMTFTGKNILDHLENPQNIFNYDDACEDDFD